MTEMSPAEAVFFAAAALPTAEQAAYLARVCAGHDDLRQRVEQMLAARPLVGDFLEPASAQTLARASESQAQTEDYSDPTACVGSILAGQYKLIEEIGEGGMGSVYMAQQTEPVKRAVAVKVIKAGMDSKAVLARLEAERQALAIMDHPNIARVLDAGSTDSGRPFFVMELVKGMPITKHCDERKLTPRQRLELFVPVCQAIQHAHQKGIIHRDIKPSNVLVAMYDDKPVPKVIDFGVAKAAGQPLTDKTLMTGFGAVVGTAQYMSPEQANLNNMDIDTRSDVYSLGVLLYELLTGSTPVDRKSLGKGAVLEILRIVREVEAVRPSAKLSTIDTLPSVAANRGTEPDKLSKLMKGELDWVVMKATGRKGPHPPLRTRPTQPGPHIQRYLADEVVEARPPSTGYRLKKFVRRHKGQVVAASLVLLALVGGIAGTAFGLIRAELSRGEAEQARHREAFEANARKIAEKARDEVAKARDALAGVEYGRTVEVAHQEWRENNVTTTLNLLNATRKDWRGWEWRYVNRLCHLDLLTLKGHDGGVNSAGFSPDGTRIVTAGWDNTAKVWDARSGALVLTLTGHGYGDLTAGIHSASFSPDGARIVTAGYDKTAKLWDALSGGELLTLKGHTAEIFSASFSPDGARIVTASGDKTAKLWDARSGALVLTLNGHTAGVTSVSFSPDGARIVTASGDSTAKVWDARSGALALTLRGHTAGITSVSFSQDGARIVTASGDHTAKVWDARSGAEILTLKGHTSGDLMAGLFSASFSPDGSRIVTTSCDNTAQVWDAAEPAPEVLTLKGHTAGISSASFSPDGSRIVTTSYDNTARVWDARSGGELLTLKGHTAEISSASFSPDGARIVTASYDRTARVWDARSGALVLTLKGHTAAVTSARFSPDGSRIVTGSADATAKVWDARSGTEVLTLKGHSDVVRSASFNPDGVRIVTASEDETAKVWDARSGAEILTLKGHTTLGIPAGVLSPDVLIGDLPFEGVNSACFSPDGSQIVTSSGDQTAKVWDARSGVEVLTLKGHTAWISSASFSPDGARIVTGSADATAKVWDARSGAEALTLKGHTSWISSASFSPDGERIVTTSGDKTAKVWDARSGALVLTLKGHTGGVTSASFSPDGSRIVTGSVDATAHVRDATPINREFLGRESTTAAGTVQ